MIDLFAVLIVLGYAVYCVIDVARTPAGREIIRQWRKRS